MKIATFNINDVNKRLANLLAWLENARPDVVCLQEIKCRNAEFPQAALRDAGYGAIWRGQGPHHGVAMLARDAEPLETRRELPGDGDDHEARYLEAAVDGILICSLYLPNGNPQPGPKFRYKLAWLERLRLHAASIIDMGIPALLIGDFNVVPTEFDIYAGKSYRDNALVQPQSRAAFKAIVDQGWIDAVRSAFPAEPCYTFWDYLRNAWSRNAGMRLDHILVSPALAPRIASAGIDRDLRALPNCSDHVPVWLVLRDR